MFSFEEGASYNARDLIKVSYEDMLASPEAANIMITFDDGTIPSTSRECIVSRIAWEMYDRFPYIRVLKDHHISRRHYSTYRKTSIGDLLCDIKWECTYECHAHGFHPDLASDYYRLYQITDMIGRLYSLRLTEYTVFFQSQDFIDVANYDGIRKANEKLRSLDRVLPADISENYQAIDAEFEATHHDVVRKQNPVVKGYWCDGYKKNQAKKIFGAYGFVTDVDSVTFPKAILDSLLSGLTDISSLYKESRTASMSLFFQKDAMRQSEYLTRMLQMGAQNVFQVWHGDCGSTDYRNIQIMSAKDFDSYSGIWYYNEETGKEEMLTNAKDQFHLISKKPKNGRPGKIVDIPIRVLSTCKLQSRTHVCSRCYGALADSLFPEDNIGHIAATELQKQVTQSILSTKHLVASGSGERNNIIGDDLNYVDPKTLNWDTLYLSKRLQGKKVKIKFRDTDAKRLQDLLHVDDIRKLLPSRTTSFTSIGFEVGTEDYIERQKEVEVAAPEREASFTYEMLEYIQTHGWDIASDGTFSVDLADWNINDPMIQIPMVQYSMPAHMKAIKAMLTTNGKDDGQRSISQYSNPHAAVLALDELVKKRLSNVHFTHMQTLVLTYLCEDPDNYDFRIPKDKSKGRMVPYDTIMFNRDFAQAMAYEKQFDTFKNPVTYIIDERHPHPHTNALRG